MYNIVFMGTPDFAVESLDSIYHAGHNIMLCVSQPDKPKGRDLKVQYTPIKEYCVNNKINIIQPEKIRKNEEFLNEIKNLNPDFIIVVAYGKILPKALLDIPKYGCINVHGSLLPKYRGAAPIQWSIINGETITGVTTMLLDEGMDTGDMLVKSKLDILPNDTYVTLYEKMKILGGKTLVETLNKFESIVPEKQSEEFTMAPMIEKELGKLDWNKTANDLNNFVRGLNPMPGAYLNIDDKTYKVWETEVIDKNSKKDIGTIVESDSKNGLQIQTKNGILSIKIIQAQNSKRMNILEYLRGNNITKDKILN